MNKSMHIQRFIQLTVVLLPLTCWAQAEPSGPGPNPQAQNVASQSLQEVVVTAEKRAEPLIDVPISIAAISGEGLQEQQITSLEDLPQAVPDLAYYNYGNNHYFEIRGVSNTVGNSPLIGIYMDEADVTLGGAGVTEINPTTYDVERVEVLRGPQGTLYGEGSAGGTIRFITRDPNLNAPAFDTDVAAQFTQDGGPSQQINAVANVPLIDDRLGMRIVGTYEHDGGWINQPAAGLKDINGQDLTYVRLKTLWKIAPQVTATAMAVINHDERGLDITDSDNPHVFTQVFNLTTTPRASNNYDLYNFTLAYQPAYFRLLNTATYLEVNAPWTYQSGRYPYAPPGTAPLDDYYAPFQTTDDHVWEDELRLTSVSPGPWQWTIGGFYRRYSDYTTIPVNYFGPEAPAGTPLPAPYAYGPETLYKSKSAFADTSYNLWDRLRIGVGGRYFSDHQDFTDHVALTHQSATFSSVDPRVYAELKIARDFNVYASAAKGFRSGGFNAAEQPAYQPEDVWTYEFGNKAALSGGRITLDTAVFLSNYTNYQTFGITDQLTGQYFISNVGSARIKGIEWDLGYQPLKGLSLDLRGDYLDARFTAIPVEASNYDVGDPVDEVPRYQFGVSARYDYMLGQKPGFVRLDYNQQGPETFRNRSIGPWYYGQSDVIHMLNLNTSLFWRENLQVGFSIQNLLNDQGFVNPANFFADGVRPRPRTYGINFSTSMQ